MGEAGDDDGGDAEVVCLIGCSSDLIVSIGAGGGDGTDRGLGSGTSSTLVNWVSLIGGDETSFSLTTTGTSSLTTAGEGGVATTGGGVATASGNDDDFSSFTTLVEGPSVSGFTVGGSEVYDGSDGCSGAGTDGTGTVGAGAIGFDTIGSGTTADGA